MTQLYNGDCLDKLKELQDNSIDSIVTDPPYGLSFMGKKWDYDVPSVEVWEECMRVLKPGGHLLAFAGSRTYHRMAVRIEDAGFEIRDQLMWIYGSGFPKSHNIGKSVDKIQGNNREVVGERKVLDMTGGNYKNTFAKTDKHFDITKGNSPYEGWGTALKPAHEPIVMARKPLSGKTVVDNVLEWGTGGINIDDSRIPTTDNLGRLNKSTSLFNANNTTPYVDNSNGVGRFPANVIFDEEAGEILDEQSGITKSGKQGIRKSDGFNKNAYGKGIGLKAGDDNGEYGDTGGASRFFYCPKTSKTDRNEGSDNNHPTVKPTDLMLYLIRLVTPKGGKTLDPFMGSGSTGKAAVRGGFDFVGIEREKEYMDIATARIQYEIDNAYNQELIAKKTKQQLTIF